MFYRKSYHRISWKSVEPYACRQTLAKPIATQLHVYPSDLLHLTEYDGHLSL